MISNPLYPSIVHFPIVLLLLGTPLAVMAVFIRKWHLPFIAMIVLGMGCAGAVMAAWIGQKDAELAGELAIKGEVILDRHEEWGKSMRIEMNDPNKFRVPPRIAVGQQWCGRA